MTQVTDNFAVATPVTVLRPTVLTADSLASLLAGAASAHHDYEASLGHADTDWQGWYSRWIMDRLPVPIETESPVRQLLREHSFEFNPYDSPGFDDEQGTYGLSAYPVIPSED